MIMIFKSNRRKMKSTKLIYLRDKRVIKTNNKNKTKMMISSKIKANKINKIQKNKFKRKANHK